MSWIKSHARAALICGLTLSLPFVFFLYVAVILLNTYWEAQNEIERIEPKLARLQGLIDYEPQLREAADVVDTRVLELVYPAAENQTAVAAELQSRMRDMFANAGLAINNTQVLPVREQGNFDYIAVKLTAKGSLTALDTALLDLSEYLPLVLVESINIYPTRVVRGKETPNEQEVTANVQLLSLRAAL